MIQIDDIKMSFLPSNVCNNSKDMQCMQQLHGHFECKEVSVTDLDEASLFILVRAHYKTSHNISLITS